MHHSRYSSNTSESTGFDIYASGCAVPLGAPIPIHSQPERWQWLWLKQQATARVYLKEVRRL